VIDLKNILSSFEPITLKEMDRVALLNRTDTKFIFSTEQLLDLLQYLPEYYKVLEIKDLRYARYRTLYYDTPEFQFFTIHQNGKKNRNKVRFRKYLDSDLCFLEIKLKNNKGRTVKSRIKVPDFEDGLSEDSQKFVNETIGRDVGIEPKLWNTFTRITLVHKKDKERLTIDLNLGFEYEDKDGGFPWLVIAEVKQETQTRQSDIIRLLKQRSILPFRISKYCMGMVLMNKKVKYNNFKQKLLKINKINDGVSGHKHI
jgi:hypothetical protein